MIEVWKPIVDFDGYEVSNLGRVHSFKYKQPRIMHPSLCGNGYFKAALSRNDNPTNFLVHRLVAQAFIPNPENKPEINHVDGDKTDNRADNLEWCTSAENKQHAVITGLKKIGEDSHNAKLTNEQICFIRDNPGNLTGGTLAEMFDVSDTVISNIQRGKVYKSASGAIRESRYVRLPGNVRNEIRRLFVKGSREFGAHALARKFGVHPQTIMKIIKESR